MAENTLLPQDDTTPVTLEDARNSGVLLRDPSEKPPEVFNPLKAARDKGLPHL